MNIDIDQLDNEEKNKIRELVREKNDKDREKGVDYIFRRSDDKEQYLLGKKLDFVDMAKDDKALMGESETEFQERMEHRKMLEKMREDPMSIIQMNEQQSRKIALEKKRVHDRLNERYTCKRERMSSSEDEGDYLEQLRSLLAKHEEDDERPLDELMALKTQKREEKSYMEKVYCENREKKSRSIEKYKNTVKNRGRRIKESVSISPESSQRNNKFNQNERYKRSENKRRRSRSIENVRRRSRSVKKVRRRSRSVKKVRRWSRSIENIRRRSRSVKKVRGRSRSVKKVRGRSRSVKKDRGRSRSIETKRRQSLSVENKKERLIENKKERSIENIYKPKYDKPSTKSKLSEEEKQRRLQEMKQNAIEHSLRCSLLEKKYQRENEKEAIEIEKQYKNHDAIILNNTIKMNQNYTLEQSLDERRKQCQVKKIFKK